jgi:hypothetical protein
VRQDADDGEHHDARTSYASASGSLLNASSPNTIVAVPRGPITPMRVRDPQGTGDPASTRTPARCGTASAPGRRARADASPPLTMTTVVMAPGRTTRCWRRGARFFDEKDLGVRDRALVGAPRPCDAVDDAGDERRDEAVRRVVLRPRRRR